MNNVKKLIVLIGMLSSGKTLMLKDIADKMGISTRQVRRYIEDLKDEGFQIEKVLNQVVVVA